ncbi:MAG: hypothetical protein AAFO06_08670 [Cyanobacteria bacterium J06597_16]
MGKGQNRVTLWCDQLVYNWVVILPCNSPGGEALPTLPAVGRHHPHESEPFRRRQAIARHA